MADGASFPIVAIGASAGGLPALRQLFAPLPDDTGMAFVVIQHLDPARPSGLPTVLSADTRMPVIETPQRVRVQPNHVYVIPSGADLSIASGFLSLVARQQSEAHKLHLPVDAFFRALAQDSPERAIGVVLSGSASDGTDGLRAIKAAGGITFAQEPESAQFPSMPESALAAGVVDFRLTPEQIASELVRLSHDPYLAPTPAREADAEETAPGDEGNLTSILAAIRRHAQLDFRGYKRPTVLRRVARRMALRHVGTLDEYAQALRDDPSEAKALAQDVLIHVTSFFRDPEVFEVLKQQVLPDLLKHKADDATFRVWVPGCSTGQEAYSIAICLVELLAERHRNLEIKIFGSDVSAMAIDSARAGLYADGDMEGVSRARIDRFFERADGGYRVNRQIRDLCVFVRHDLTIDPPFARLDLISCRNVLIYFDIELQRRLLPLLHHCLNKPGCLVLGSSEGVREFDALFAPVDRTHRIFLKTGQSPRLAYPLAMGQKAESKLPTFQPVQRAQPARDAQRQADHILLTRYAPPGVVVNDHLEVVQFRGRTGDFLEPAPGQPQTNVLKMAREGLVGHLHEALEAAKAQSITVRKEGVRLVVDGRSRLIDLEVVPLAGADRSAERYFLVVFEEARDRAEGEPRPALPGARDDRGHPDQPQSEDIARLRAELAATRDYLQSISGEHQDTVEDLGAANEELVAANEELQSTNEELQSAKEELQSTNEELTTLNDELHSRNLELDRIANDLVNVLESVQIPVIMVDQDLRIRRFTPTAQQVSSLQAGDLGRSIDDVKLKVKVDDLAQRIRDTIESITPKEYEIQGLDNRWFRLHIRPYRTTDNRLDGAILSFVDVDVLKRALQETERARDYAQRIIETVPVALVVIDANLCVVSANPPFYDIVATRPNLAAGSPALFELAGGALNVPAFRGALDRALASRSSFRGLEIECRFPVAEARNFVIAGCPIQSAEGPWKLLLAIENVTQHRLLEASEKQARIEAEQANRAKDLFLATLSHELRTPLSTILMSAQLLKSASMQDPGMRRASLAIERAAGNQSRLIDDLLDISRIVSGKLLLDLQAVDLLSVVQNAVDVAQSSADAKGIGLELSVPEWLPPVHGDPDRLQQVFANLINNSIKFTPRGGKIAVRLEAADGQARITVTDTGRGLSPEIIPHLFDRFVQAESSMTRAHGGLGLGLAIARHIVNVHGGEIHAESRGEGQGSTFSVTLPLAAHGAIAPSRSGTVARSIQAVRVLLIEDDDDARLAFATMLGQQGAEVQAARSAAEGMAAVQTFAPQVILCDIAMPGEDGYSFIRELRGSRDRRRSQIPAAALTALAGEEDRRRALEAGFQMHLAKPIDSDRLAAAVATLAAWPQQADA